MANQKLPDRNTDRDRERLSVREPSRRAPLLSRMDTDGTPPE